MKHSLSLVFLALLLVGCGQENRPSSAQSNGTPAVQLVVPTPLATVTQPAAPPVLVAEPEQMLAEAITAVFPTIPATPADPSFGRSDELVVTDTVSGILEPLLIHSERGRIYAQAQVDGVPRTAVLSVADGRLLASYELSGRLALDRAHNRLVVDQGAAGLAILDAETGSLLATVGLPAAESRQAAPQVDSTSGVIYAFRDKSVYVIDGSSGRIERTVEPNIGTIVCGEPGGPAVISESLYDQVHQKLYLTFITYICTPSVGVSIVAFDAATMAELGRQGAEIRYQAVAFGDNLYGTSVSRLGPISYWAWNEAGEWFDEGNEYEGNLAGITADWGRQLVYEAVGSQVRIIDPGTRQVINRVDVPLLASDGRLVGHDPISDNLYFLVGGGRLEVWAAGNLSER